jgi:hypothetical protein
VILIEELPLVKLLTCFFNVMKKFMQPRLFLDGISLAQVMQGA